MLSWYSHFASLRTLVLLHDKSKITLSHFQWLHISLVRLSRIHRLPLYVSNILCISHRPTRSWLPIILASVVCPPSRNLPLAERFDFENSLPSHSFFTAGVC